MSEPDCFHGDRLSEHMGHRSLTRRSICQAASGGVDQSQDGGAKGGQSQGRKRRERANHRGGGREMGGVVIIDKLMSIQHCTKPGLKCSKSLCLRDCLTTLQENHFLFSVRKHSS